MKEALYYQHTDKGILCTLCPHSCILQDGETGKCRTRVRKDDKLYTLAYSNACAVHIDPIEKKPLLHFLPGTKTLSIATAGCNFSCLNCQNYHISQKSPLDIDNIIIEPQEIVDLALKNNCDSIAYTYTEPIVFYEYTLDTAKLAKNKGLKNVIVSAGYINEAPLRELVSYIDAANIDLKSFSNDIYRKLSGGSLHPVLRTLKILKDSGVWLEITNLLIPSYTDDFDMITDMCNWLVNNGFDKYPLHFSRFSPYHKLKHLPLTPEDTLVNAYKIAKSAGMKYVFIGNIWNIDAENTYCPNCGNLLIERYGFRVLSNKIKEGKCPKCGTEINGIWVK